MFVDVAMFVERYLIVVAGLRNPTMPYEPADYFPSWVEWSIFAGGLAFFMLAITIAVKVFPMLAVSEMVEEKREALSGELSGARVRTGVADHADPVGGFDLEGSRT